MAVAFQAKAVQTGADYENHVSAYLEVRGYQVIGRHVRHDSGVQFDLLVRDSRGNEFGVECKGSEQDKQPPSSAGMYRTDNKWKVLGYLYLLRAWKDRTHGSVNYILATSHLPEPGNSTRQILDDAVMLGDLQHLLHVPFPATDDH
jgi:hypothetical protein